jgi:hypothetical protein
MRYGTEKNEEKRGKTSSDKPQVWINIRRRSLSGMARSVVVGHFAPPSQLPAATFEVSTLMVISTIP